MMMEETCHSSAITATAINGNYCSSDTLSSSSTQNTLRLLNKSSHKISKPTTTIPKLHHHPPPPSDQPSQQQSQPPVYNINKSDFRDVVQKLTGSHHHQQRVTSPPVIPPTKPTPSSRLHKIRPPPLAHLIPHPTPIPPAPLSPLPPFPTVSGAAAESPISAYMRRLQSWSGITGGSPPFLPSPGSAAASVLNMPSSPLGFGCVHSPPTAGYGYPLMPSPGLLFPPSPTLPMTSPSWRNL